MVKRQVGRWRCSGHLCGQFVQQVQGLRILRRLDQIPGEEILELPGGAIALAVDLLELTNGLAHAGDAFIQAAAAALTQTQVAQFDQCRLRVFALQLRHAMEGVACGVQRLFAMSKQVMQVRDRTEGDDGRMTVWADLPFVDVIGLDGLLQRRPGLIQRSQCARFEREDDGLAARIEPFKCNVAEIGFDRVQCAVRLTGPQLRVGDSLLDEVAGFDVVRLHRAMQLAGPQQRLQHAVEVERMQAQVGVCEAAAQCDAVALQQQFARRVVCEPKLGTRLVIVVGVDETLHETVARLERQFVVGTEVFDADVDGPAKMTRRTVAEAVE
ncbi:hypothetical protein B1808_09795 [Pseudofulvimonas gallinarii]|nr:hypothetical protein B1808_09795 [Pseudofulvimonas gallinarii]